MCLMISTSLKPAVTRAINPVAKGLLRMGATANGVTFAGASALIVSALYFLPRGDLFVGCLVISFFCLSDLFDGAMARISQQGASSWGGFLDSTLDRIADAAIVSGVLLYLLKTQDELIPVALVALVSGFLISYIRAKAESLGIECSVGVAERTERLVIALTCIGLEGLSVPYALATGFWLLAILGLITVSQRLIVVRKGTLER